MDKKALLKSVEDGLNRGVQAQKAREILKMFAQKKGIGVPTEMVKHAVKVLYQNNKKKIVKKERKMTQRISKYVDQIEKRRHPQ